jgi:hypothetical protein
MWLRLLGALGWSLAYPCPARCPPQEWWSGRFYGGLENNEHSASDCSSTQASINLAPQRQDKQTTCCVQSWAAYKLSFVYSQQQAVLCQSHQRHLRRQSYDVGYHVSGYQSELNGHLINKSCDASVLCRVPEFRVLGRAYSVLSNAQEPCLQALSAWFLVGFMSREIIACRRRRYSSSKVFRSSFSADKQCDWPFCGFQFASRVSFSAGVLLAGGQRWMVYFIWIEPVAHAKWLPFCLSLSLHEGKQGISSSAMFSVHQRRFLGSNQIPDSRCHPRLECGHCSPGTPLPDFPIFAPLHAFFGKFSPKLDSTTLI